jgi:pyruvate dehydrogenase complex dehydrogenase (E1) component
MVGDSTPGLDGIVIGIDSFGESAPAADVFAHFGLTVEQVVATIDDALENASREQSAELSQACPLRRHVPLPINPRGRQRWL